MQAKAVGGGAVQWREREVAKMFDDEDRPAPPREAFPRKLDAMSIEALEYYIRDLQAEIERVKAEIDNRRRLQGEAQKFFKGG